MPETRKLAAIMAVDVVGYSRLIDEDEAGTAQTVREHRDAARPLVANRGRRIVKTMGDGLLLEFLSAVDAVECAVAIQQLTVQRDAGRPENKRIVYRIGASIGRCRRAPTRRVGGFGRVGPSRVGPPARWRYGARARLPVALRHLE
jgi:class 3 adenylate cyclase